ncbi:type I phosphomannose isomerase catalytic subunit [Algibacter luteus]|uniref:type I phosphomannose isomerase catalytic subunit n=1 Tax=Algibacter luteus TaxID=1178825 RepID=UPI002592BB00|nr:type I phosphomannose isomerase catalytic subunit [Algibacter luteus]WJJ95733.1 mannose-6-phosphate isomerase [Algibacter luteus]
MNLYPLKFTPISKYRLWGGNKLNKVLNKGFKGDNNGESWEISDVKGDETKVANGEFSRKTLKELTEQFKGQLLGDNVYKTFGTEFPLLIKFIDAKTPLSIQVHPHDHIAKERHDSFGKNEMWYIMDADDSAEIIVGFNKQLDKNSYSKYLENNKVLEVLNSVKTKAGDAFNIPTGRVHAIGAGVLLAEIQQTSDITYRIYDYDRVDKTTGEKRELHNDLALDVLDFEVQEAYTTAYKTESNVSNKLIHTPYFKTNIIYLTKEINKDYTKIDSFVIYICTEGCLEITVDNANYSLAKGESILIPAIINQLKLTPQKESKILEVYY